MTANADPWLPMPALLDGALARIVAQAATGWAHAWFGANETVLASTQTAPKNQLISGDTLAWASECSGAVLTAPTGTPCLLGLSILAPASAKKLTELDRRFLGALGEKCLTDLLRVLARTFGATTQVKAAPTRSVVGAALRFALAGRAQGLEVFIAQPLAVRARKTLLPPQPPREIAARSVAIERTDVDVGAMVGVQTLSFGAVQALRVGDLVVLDRSVTEPLALVVNDAVSRGPFWTLQKKEDRLHLSVAAENAA